MWHKAGTVCAILLLAVSVVWLAQITWLLFTPRVVVGPSMANTSFSEGVAQRANVRSVQALQLFGEAGAVTAVSIQDAPETTLNIRLVGVTASTNPALSAAIIQQGSNQATYIPGDTIQGSRAVLSEIFSDRVLLENNNRTETLWLDGRDGSEAPLALNVASPRSSRPSESVTSASSEAEIAEPELSASQREVLEVISIQPERNEEGLVGYRVGPKGDIALFRELGFVDGDIAVAINGYDLTNMAEAMELMNELQGMSEAQVRVLRNGEFVDIDIYLPSE